MCERFAREGWLAVAPHLYHRDGDPQLTYDDVPTALGYLANLTKEPVLEDFDAALCNITDTQIPSTKVGAVGFCMGGTLALVMAAERTIGAGVTFDGSDPIRRRRSRVPLRRA